MTEKLTDYDHWLPEAAKVAKTDNPLNIPYDIALKEAADAAGFIQKYWHASGEVPGVERVKKRLPKSTSEDILSLIQAVKEAQSKLLLLTDPAVVDIGERARFVADELESALEFLLDDDIEEPADDQLATIKKFHSQDGQRSSALSRALHDFAALAATLKDRLVEEDSDFDPALIDEAKKLSAALSKKPADGAIAASETATTGATRIRNQLLHLLMAKVALTRRTAAHVFRKHPAIVREVMSAYERRRRAAGRRAKAAEAAKATEPTKTP